jgi:prepilin-type N-terminal cleavage/methylation domain-containing protein
MKRIRNNAGFTLIELLVVLVIIGILTAIAVTKYQDMTTEAQIAATKGNLATIRGGITLIHARLILAGVTPASAQWPTVAELNNNVMSRPGTPADLLRIVEGPAAPTCASCMPPDSVISSARTVALVSTANADARTPSGGAGIGWDYDPATGQIYVAAAATTDSLGNTANLW